MADRDRTERAEGPEVLLDGAFTRPPAGRAPPAHPASDAVATLPATLGRYELLDLDPRDGVGGTAVVFRARDTRLGRFVALKVAKPSADAEAFRRESSSAAPVFHPNVPPVLDAGEVDGRPFYTMPWVGDRTLAAFVRAEGPGRAAVRVVATAAAALASLHERDRIHGDPSPANVRVGDDGAVWLVDAGQSRAVGERVRAAFTPGYAAPEVVGGAQPTTRSDVWALGALVALAAGPHADRPIASVVDRCCGAAEQRPDAAVVAADLDRWLTGEPLALHRYGVGERAVRWARRRAGWLAGAGIAAGLLVAVGSYALVQVERAGAREREARHAEAARLALQARRILDEDGDPSVAERHAAEALRLVPDPVTRGTRIAAASRWQPEELRRRAIGDVGVSCPRVDPVGGEVTCLQRQDVVLLDGRDLVRIRGAAAAARTLPDGGRVVVRPDGLEWIGPDGEVRRVPLSGRPVRLASLADGVVTVREDGRVDSFALDGTLRWSERAPDPEVRGLAVDPHTGTAFVGDWRGGITELGVRGREPFRARAAEHGANVLALSSDGRRLAAAWREAGGDGRAVVVHAPRDGGPPLRLTGHRGHVTAMAFAPDHPSLLASGDVDGVLRLWDVADGSRLATVELPGRIAAVWWSPDGRELHAVGRDAGFLATFRVPERVPRREVVRAGAGLLRVRAAGAFLAAVGDDGWLRGWRGGVEVGAFPLGTDQTMALALRDDGRAISGNARGEVVAVDLATGTARPPVPIEGLLLPYDAAFTEDGGAVVLGAMGVQGTPGRVWLLGWPELHPLAPPRDLSPMSVAGVALLPDGAIAASTVDGHVHRLERSDLRPTALARADGVLSNVAVRPGRDELAVGEGMRFGAVVRVDARTGTILGRGPQPPPGPVPVAWSPSGAWLASGGGDGALRIWDGVGSVPLAIVEDAHDGEVWSVWFGEEARLYSAGGDGALRSWDLRSLAEGY